VDGKALAAHPLIWSERSPIDIIGGEFVPVGAVRLGSVPRCHCISASDVLGMSDWFEVIGVHARAITTEVVQIESFRDRSVEVLIRETMRADGLAVQLEVRIPLSVPSAGPHPAARVGNVNLREEAG
jgi:hypothetical protein